MDEAQQNKAEELRSRVQQSIVSIITARVKDGSMSEARARQIAELVLEKLPEGINYQQLIEVLPTLDDHFEELSTAVMPIMIEYERKLQAAVDKKIGELLSQGNLDALLDVTNKALEMQKRLS
ncbi:MAG: hypothetical protein TR69_WS6001000837 [candidate division WS6 bacterium OLB20]|uniref:Uncharacterized protein n=1 Tax=candidate division WS6 bacterium OLB20 TaxID=1617426 RepID=A0A136LYY0_9BACT|nr:MAG: hypothetical protein TR69_WS6001000837 [candidate division WS6 bacterium OLB20]